MPRPATRSLIVWGTSSGAGKSWLATALCRLAARRGIDVAPFKAQNMSNNARVVPRRDGEIGEMGGVGRVGEIGSAQYFQALAARVAPHTGINPVLLKPERDTASQVVLNGVADPALSRLGWRERSGVLAQAAQASLRRLAQQHELIVIEGAGSPAEINLADHDYVNLGVARWARELGPTAALLVSDIDRGGAFAHLHGTWALLPEDLRGLLAGYVLNRFRGDAALLAPGPQLLQQLTGLPLAGVIPLRRGHGLPEEDGWFQTAEDRGDGSAALHVVVVAPPHISNLDEFAPLNRVPGLRLGWARCAAQLAGADWIVLPGSKQTSGDLAWLRRQGLDAAIGQHAAAGKPVLGICGGLQMLGRTLDDPQGSDGEVVQGLPGLGLLPLCTHFGEQKHLSHGRVRFAGETAPPWAALRAVSADAYQIRCGRTLADAASAVLFDAAGQAIGWQSGSVLGVYAHGLFESPAVLQALFGAGVPVLDDSFELLADMAQEHLDPVLLRRLFGQ